MKKPFTLLLFAVSCFAAPSSSWLPAKLNSMVYPRLGLQAQISGEVRLKIEIDVSGAVGEIIAISGHPLLIDAAKKNLRDWKFMRVQGQVGSERDKAIEFVYVFRLLSDTPLLPNPQFVYEYPNRVTLTANPLHWQP